MAKWITILQTRPWFLVLLPAFLVIHIEQNFSGLINYSLVWKPILLLLLIPLLIYAFAWLLSRDKSKAAAYALIALIPYFFFCDLKDWLHENHPTVWFGRYVIIFPFLVVMTGLAMIGVKRNIISLHKLFLFTNLLLLISILTDAASILIKKSSVSNQYAELKLEPCKDCKRPDIYYLLFDCYSSSDLLKEKFGFDNQDLDSFLAQKGFYVSRKSKSNYNFTIFSLGSIFNLDYIPSPDSMHLLTARGLLPGIERIKNASLFPAMEQLGYKIYNHSIFNIRNHSTNTQTFDIWELSGLYNRHQLPWKLFEDIGWNFEFLSALDIDRKFAEEYIRNRDLNFESTIQELGNTVKLKDAQPKFVYVHSLIPHPPYSYDSSGHHIPFQGYSVEGDMQAYVQQLAFSNKIIKKVVDDILSQNDRDCIILLQGDHAYRFFDQRQKKEEFRNLNAWYFPDRDYHLLNDSLSSVNSFRLLLNTHFGQQLPILPDSSIFLPYRISF